jgi:sterol desaturase/sphingolipid hydroxylase (fatty acid hydroxylase superfamily)
LKAVLLSLPTYILFPGSGWIIGTILGFQGNYLHSSSRLNFGRFAWIIADNHTHRIHHSLDERHFGRNFGAVTMLWDRLFGTAYFPAPHEWPDVGLAGQRAPQSVGDYLLRPLRPAVKANHRPRDEIASG